MISLIDIEQAVQQAAPYHHPHFQGAEKNQYNTVRLTFREFTGEEDMPNRPAESRRDETLSRTARELLEEEYDMARALWRDARYVRDLKRVAAGAGTVWDAVEQARREMGEAFAALDRTESSRWHAAVSTLITTQNRALTAAKAWDERARRIAGIHYNHMSSELSRAQAYERAGVDGSGWLVGDYYDYERRVTPLVQELTKEIDRQRVHVRTVAHLTGSHGQA
ncbi:hypothetical protein [Streptomyces hygroscopicus]|uniref:hypothetical protein n=1 Tax=Streptomyces hygroscopicus TaxID=1912 RepID=UPI0007816583|nr:hypothetical protein [Streptomyces hygroscopicus]